MVPVESAFRWEATLWSQLFIGKPPYGASTTTVYQPDHSCGIWMGREQYCGDVCGRVLVLHAKDTPCSLTAH